MGSFLRWIKGAFLKLTDLFRSGRAQAALDKVVALIPQALSIVEIVARLTPTRADDEIVDLFKRFGILNLVDAYLGMPVANRGDALKRAAIEALKKQEGETPVNILSAAIDMAYLKYVADQKVAEGAFTGVVVGGAPEEL